MFLSRAATTTTTAARVLRRSCGPPLTLTRGFHWGSPGCVGWTPARFAGQRAEPYRHRGSTIPDWRHLSWCGGLAQPGVLFSSNRGLSTAPVAPKKTPAMDDNNAQDECSVKEGPPTPPPEGKAPGGPEPGGDKPNKTQQLKKVFKEYGAVGVSFHVGISLMSLGMFYLLVSSGIDMAAVLGKLGFSEAIIRSKMAAGTSTFVLAYAVHKLFAPARISITLVCVPFIVRHFRRTGLFKPPPTSAP
ncbi:protein FAM210B, mitochondrial [Syngnathoides biaculeatus]|uniref:protein FAM210B, mitochondrial n=1 Tax=Syngnathoides biaculeatus TaxID=300417 RepID=UPI002ADE6878|nr:protein FAM210B, mitochondrial [Syngnathoides biaculeatus]